MCKARLIVFFTLTIATILEDESWKSNGFTQENEHYHSTLQ